MVRGRSSSRKLLAVAAVAIAAVAFGGCDWTMFGFDPALTHSSFDHNINTANASTIKQLFTSPGQFSAPVESNGVVYAGSTSGSLEAFDANGTTDCSGTPNQCSPLWTGAIAGGDDLDTRRCQRCRLRHHSSHKFNRRFAVRLRRQRGHQLLGESQGVSTALDRSSRRVDSTRTDSDQRRCLRLV